MSASHLFRVFLRNGWEANEIPVCTICENAPEPREGLQSELTESEFPNSSSRKDPPQPAKLRGDNPRRFLVGIPTQRTQNCDSSRPNASPTIAASESRHAQRIYAPWRRKISSLSRHGQPEHPKQQTKRTATPAVTTTAMRFPFVANQ